jgi:hypothetical protein
LVKMLRCIVEQDRCLVLPATERFRPVSFYVSIHFLDHTGPRLAKRACGLSFMGNSKSYHQGFDRCYDNIMKNRVVNWKVAIGAISAELLVIALATWISAGLPGLRADDGPPSVTIQFGPGFQVPPLGRSQRI